jgi:hypothetical protein
MIKYVACHKPAVLPGFNEHEGRLCSNVRFGAVPGRNGWQESKLGKEALIALKLRTVQ